MSLMDDRPTPDRHPVVYGLLALVGVAAVVGLILGLGALTAAKVTGLDGEASSTASGDGASMYLPKPQKTKADTGPSITLAPGEESSSSTEAASPLDKKSKKEKQQRKISLSASQPEASPMEQIDLTGVYPQGEGAILQVQRFESGQWADFSSVTASVSNETFATYVQVGQPGVNRFRVVDESRGLVSNEVKVTIR